MRHDHPRRRSILKGAAAMAVAATLPAGRAAAQDAVRSARATFRAVRVADRLAHPWSLAFLPDGTMLVTERPGRLRLLSPDGEAASGAVGGVPDVVASGQGGLLDVCLHPDFATNRTIYLSYAAAVPGGANTRVVRAVLDGDRLARVEVLFTAAPAAGGGNHFGSRLAFDRDGYLFVAVGERNDRDRAQDLASHNGKTIRLHDDGRVPADNPFVGRDGARPEIFSWGHRNPQGMATHPATGIPWLNEHGPRGGDEVNIVRAGVNYGWPVITYGREYYGPAVGEGLTARDGMAQPIWYWVPSIAPSGMAFYTADRFPGWRGSLFVGALVGRLLARLELDGDRVLREERLLEGDVGRIRDVRQGPDGLVYILTDASDGELWRLEPVA
ncbi:MAG: PQQ-dependent sugar dehydrogenase [Alphaproteobacteria bacterium]